MAGKATLHHQCADHQHALMFVPEVMCQKDNLPQGLLPGKILTLLIVFRRQNFVFDFQAELQELQWVKGEAQAKEKAARLESELAMRSVNTSQHQLQKISSEMHDLQQQQQQFLVRLSSHSWD